MTDTGPAPGTTPSGGWRHRPRPVRAVRAEWVDDLEGSYDDLPAGDRRDGAPPPEACPWLFLAAEPNVRAGFVTDSHRCELRPDIVPGPGHQLAYCVTTNHVSCPQLRAYEGRRQAGAAGEPAVLPITPTAPTAPELPHRVAAPGAWRAEWAKRAPWLVAGALAALGLALMLALVYSAPSPQALTPPAAEPATAPPAAPTAPTTPTAPAAPALQEAAPPPLPTPSSDPLDRTNGSGAAAPEATPGPPAEESSDGDAATEVPAAPALVPYVVEAGDTLLIIAWRFGIPLDDLLAANGLGFQSTIYQGQQLLLPLPRGEQ
jgi:hypothetical protein